MRNLKRVLSLALAAMMLVGMMVVGASAVNTEDFADYGEIKHTEAVDVMVALNVIDGIKSGDTYNFKPEGTLTRAQMSKIISYVMNGGVEPVLGVKDVPTYSDIDDHWAEKYIEYCTSMGIIAGVGQGKFNPEGTLTGEQAAKMLLTAMGYNANVFGFVGSNWAVNVNRYANEAGLYKELGSMDPSQPISRDNACQLAYNAIQGTMMKRTWSQDMQTGEIGESYSLWYDDAANTIPHTLLGDKFDGAIKLAYLSNYSYDDTKALWTYTFTNAAGGEFGSNELTSNNALTADTTETQKSAEDYTAFYGRQVKVVYNTQNTDVIYGVYANDSSVVVEGFSGDVTAASDDVAGEVKINGVIYKLDDLAASTPVYNPQNSTSVGSLAGMASGAITGYYSYQMIDNNGNGKVDAVILTPFTFAKVTYVGSDSATFTLQHGLDTNVVTGNVKLADIITYEGMAKDDYVMGVDASYASKEADTYTKLDIVTGTVTGLRDTDGNGSYDEFKIDDNWYTANLPAVTLNSGDNVEYIALGNHIYYAKVLEGTIGADAVAVVYDIDDKTVTGIGSNYIEAGLLLADGTKVVGEVVEVNSDEVDAGDTAATTFTGADAKGDSVSVAGTALKGELVKYEVDGDKGIHIWTIPASYDAAAASTQIMGFDGTLAAGASFNNSNDQVGGKELADDAVVFVWNNTKDSAKVYTGKEIKNTQHATFGGGTTYTTGLYGKVNGFSYAQVVVLQAGTWPTITTGSGYGYLVKDAYANKEDGVWYRYYSYWNGSEVVEAKEKNQSAVSDFKAGSVITFDDNGDGTIKNVSLPLVRVGYVEGVNADGRVEISGETDNTKYNADTTIFYVDSGAVNPTGIAGGEITEGVDVNNDTVKENNVMFITGGNNTFALIVVDVKHEIQKVNPVQQNKVYSGTQTPADATAVTNLLNELNSYNVTVNGDLDLGNADSTITIDGKYDLVVTGDLDIDDAALTVKSDVTVDDIVGTGTITVDGGSLTVTKTGSALTATTAITVKSNGTMSVAQLGNNAITLGESGVATSKGTLTVGTTTSGNFTGGTVGNGNVTLHGTSELKADALGGALTVNNTAVATVGNVTGNVTVAGGTLTAGNLDGTFTVSAGSATVGTVDDSIAVTGGTVTASALDASTTVNLTTGGTLNLAGTIGDDKITLGAGTLNLGANYKVTATGDSQLTGGNLVLGENVTLTLHGATQVDITGVKFVGTDETSKVNVSDVTAAINVPANIFYANNDTSTDLTNLGDSGAGATGDYVWGAVTATDAATAGYGFVK